MYIFGKLLIALFVMNLNFMYASIKVVAAENFYGKLAETIGGEYVEVYNIMNSSVDPHSFVSSPRDMKSINYADIIIYNGSNYDPWIKHLLKLKDKEKNFVAIDVSLLTDLHYDPNPHIWFDPRTFPRLAQELCNLFEKTVSTQENSYFSRNLQKFLIEYEEVLEQYTGMGLNVKGVDSSKLFIESLDGVIDPEKKRKIIGNTFVKVFEEESKKIENAKWLAQGTIYPDVIESVSVKGPSATIKSHHNVGGLPEKMNLKVVEPLKMLFKDEVRRIGKSLKMYPDILNRHPFPGPGLGIRILGEVDFESVRLIQEADKIYIDGLKEWNLYDKIWQAGSILLPVKSVGVMGDERTYERCVALRAVVSTDGMTADWYEFPNNFLKEVSNRIINKVSGINRVVYDISSKPPATIEWE